MTPTKKTVRLIIHGRVQGVSFRDTMRREAQRLKITGGVRNRSDGKVEAVVHGEFAAVDDIVRWAHRGPEHAQVERIDVESDDGRYTHFEVIG